MNVVSDGPEVETKKRNSAHGFWYPYFLIAPTMITLIVISFLPFLYTVYLSVHEARYGKVQDFVGFENFLTVLGDSRFWNSMWVAVNFVLIAVPIEFMLGLAGALVLNAGVKYRSVIVPMMFIPTMMAPIVVGLLWKIMFAGSWGLLSYNLFERFGILENTSIFGSQSLALYGIILVDIWQWTPFMMLAFFAGLQSLPVNPYRAASIDGANPVQVFFLITLPLLSPLLVVIMILRLIDAFKIFDSIFILTGGGPGSVTESPSILAYKMTFEYWEIGQASALAVIVWLLFFGFCSLFYKVAKKQLKAF